MTALTLFGVRLLTFSSRVGQGAVVLCALAAALLCMNLVLPITASTTPEKLRRGKRIGFIVGGIAGLLGFAGLRVQPLAYSLNASSWNGLLDGLTVAALAVGCAVVAYAVSLAVVLKRDTNALAPSTTGDDMETAIKALEDLRAALRRLESTHAEAVMRAKGPGEPVVLEEYQRTADAIAQKITLGSELQTAASGAVLRLACRAPLRALLESRPDACISAVAHAAGREPIRKRVAVAATHVGRFMEQAERVHARLQSEATGAPGSVSARIGMDASKVAASALATAEELQRTYGRVHHRLEAMRLRLDAAADAGTAVQAAMTLSVDGNGKPLNPHDLAAEIHDTEEASRRALLINQDEPLRVVEAVAKAATSFQQGDQERLRDLLAAMRDLS